MTQHTPGPWCLHLVDDTTIIDARGRFIASVCGGDDQLGEADYNNSDEWPVLEANARLIAAAPELYGRAKATEALLVLAFGEPPLLQPPGDRERQPTRYAAWDEIRQLRAAIAKVEGRS